jgi:uncharacterized protein YdaU (DUF1376 family)
MKKIAFHFYPADFIMGTSMMTAEETGGYIRLLCHQWDNGYIVNKDIILKQLTGVYNDEAIKSIKNKFIENNDGNLINKRLESVRESYLKHQKKQSENGKKGGRPKNPNKTQIKPNEKQVRSTTHIHKTIKTIKDYKDLIENRGYFKSEELKDVFIKFLENRIAMKKPPTEYAVGILVKNLMNLSEENGKPNGRKAIKIVENAIESNWQKFYKIKESEQVENKQFDNSSVQNLPKWN